jgi:hypothetical protein
MLFFSKILKRVLVTAASHLQLLTEILNQNLVQKPAIRLTKGKELLLIS